LKKSYFDLNFAFMILIFLFLKHFLFFFSHKNPLFSPYVISNPLFDFIASYSLILSFSFSL